MCMSPKDRLADCDFCQNRQSLMASRRTPKHLGAFVLVFEMARRKMDVPYVNGAHGVVVSHPLNMREALGSIPSVSIFVFSQKSHAVLGTASDPYSNNVRKDPEIESDPSGTVPDLSGTVPDPSGTVPDPSGTAGLVPAPPAAWRQCQRQPLPGGKKLPGQPVRPASWSIEENRRIFSVLWKYDRAHGSGPWRMPSSIRCSSRREKCPHQESNLGCRGHNATS